MVKTATRLIWKKMRQLEMWVHFSVPTFLQAGCQLESCSPLRRKSSPTNTSSVAQADGQGGPPKGRARGLGEERSGELVWGHRTGVKSRDIPYSQVTPCSNGNVFAVVLTLFCHCMLGVYGKNNLSFWFSGLWIKKSLSEIWCRSWVSWFPAQCQNWIRFLSVFGMEWVYFACGKGMNICDQKGTRRALSVNICSLPFLSISVGQVYFSALALGFIVLFVLAMRITGYDMSRGLKGACAVELAALLLQWPREKHDTDPGG